jgi:hypothetical protein
MTLVSFLLAGGIALAASAPGGTARGFNLRCEIDGVHGPDGQPMAIEWSIEPTARSACEIPGCTLKAVVHRVSKREVWLEFARTGGGTQLFKIDRRTGAFSWMSGRKYTGSCRESFFSQQ